MPEPAELPTRDELAQLLADAWVPAPHALPLERIAKSSPDHVRRFRAQADAVLARIGGGE